jgi:hypothetical protein
MRKAVIVFISLLIALSFTADTKAMEYMAGAKSGYYAWQPFLKDVGASGMSDIEWGTGMLYGPIVSLIFMPDLSFSVAGLIGEQSTHWQSIFSDFDNTTKVTGTYYFEAFRADFDSALSYRLTENFKIFAGYKYQYLKFTYRYTEIRTDTSGNITEIDVVKMDNMRMPLHGPAFGLGLSLPLGMKYFFAANLSGIYLQGKSKFKSKNYNSNGGADPLEYDPDSKSTDFKVRQMGLNFEPAIGFSAGEGLPIVTLGFRYQRFWVRIPDATGDPFPKKTFDDILVGGFISAVFMF